MNHTPNYQLSRWERTDRVQMEDFNADNAKIDAALKAEADARTAAVAGLTQTRNCQVYYTSYVGTGDTGSSYPNRMTFPHRPVFVHVAGKGATFSAVRDSPNAICADTSDNTFSIAVSWSGNTISWYAESTPGFSNNSRFQCNDKDKPYYLCAVLELED